jgi:hypothetical protein
MEKRLTILRDSTFIKISILISTIFCILLKGALIVCSLNLVDDRHDPNEIQKLARDSFLFKCSENAN